MSEQGKDQFGNENQTTAGSKEESLTAPEVERQTDTGTFVQGDYGKAGKAGPAEGEAVEGDYEEGDYGDAGTVDKS